MISDFFIFCSGASKDIIAQCPSSERNKYASIGATVFLTALLAAVSGGYALYSIFYTEAHAIIATLTFGILWGTVIFNLDRYIVSSLRKEGKRKKEILQALPRFAIAILISLVIAKPLEVRIFADRIEQQILENKLKKMAKEKKDIQQLNDIGKYDTAIAEQEKKSRNLDSARNTDPPTAQFSQLLQSESQAEQDLENKRQNNRPKIDACTSKINKLSSDDSNKEYNPSSSKLVLKQEVRNEIQDLAAKRKALGMEIIESERALAGIKGEIRDRRREHDSEVAKKIFDHEKDKAKTLAAKANADSVAKFQIDQSDSVKSKSYTNNFITQVEALGDLDSAPWTTMWCAGWLISLLFIAIETAPVVTKLLSNRGPYDEMLERVEYEHNLLQKQIISEKNNEVNNLLAKIKRLNTTNEELKIKTLKSKLDAQLKTNDVLLNEISQKQAELGTMAIEKWFNEEKENIKNAKGRPAAAQKPAIENRFWKIANGKPDTYCYFKDDEARNELIYIEEGISRKGYWEYTIPLKEIMIELSNNKDSYSIENLTENSARLVGDRDVNIELIAV